MRRSEARASDERRRRCGGARDRPGELPRRGRRPWCARLRHGRRARLPRRSPRLAATTGTSSSAIPRASRRARRPFRAPSPHTARCTLRAPPSWLREVSFAPRRARATWTPPPSWPRSTTPCLAMASSPSSRSAGRARPPHPRRLSRRPLPQVRRARVGRPPRGSPLGRGPVARAGHSSASVTHERSGVMSSSSSKSSS